MFLQSEIIYHNVLYMHTQSYYNRYDENLQTQIGKTFEKEVCTMLKNDTVITINRLYGSGGRIMGKRLSEEFDIPFYDEEILTMAWRSPL